MFPPRPLRQALLLQWVAAHPVSESAEPLQAEEPASAGASASASGSGDEDMQQVYGAVDMSDIDEGDTPSQQELDDSVQQLLMLVEHLGEVTA